MKHRNSLFNVFALVTMVAVAACSATDTQDNTPLDSLYEQSNEPSSADSVSVQIDTQDPKSTIFSTDAAHADVLESLLAQLDPQCAGEAVAIDGDTATVAVDPAALKAAASQNDVASTDPSARHISGLFSKRTFHAHFRSVVSGEYCRDGQFYNAAQAAIWASAQVFGFTIAAWGVEGGGCP